MMPGVAIVCVLWVFLRISASVMMWHWWWRPPSLSSARHPGPLISHHPGPRTSFSDPRNHFDHYFTPIKSLGSWHHGKIGITFVHELQSYDIKPWECTSKAIYWKIWKESIKSTLSLFAILFDCINTEHICKIADSGKSQKLSIL